MDTCKVTLLSEELQDGLESLKDAHDSALSDLQAAREMAMTDLRAERDAWRAERDAWIEQAREAYRDGRETVHSEYVGARDLLEQAYQLARAELQAAAEELAG